MSSEETTGTGAGTTSVSTPIGELHRIAAEQQRRTESAILKEALAMSSETCNKLLEEQTTLIKSLKEQELKFADDLKKETTEATEKAASALGERVSEITLAYRQVMEKETEEVRKTATALTKVLEAEPMEKKEAAEILRTSIEVAAENLTSYYKLRLADSLSDLDGSLKKTKDKMEDLGERCTREKKFSRVLRYAETVLVVATFVMTLIGLLI